MISINSTYNKSYTVLAVKIKTKSKNSQNMEESNA